MNTNINEEKVENKEKDKGSAQLSLWVNFLLMFYSLFSFVSFFILTEACLSNKTYSLLENIGLILTFLVGTVISFTFQYNTIFKRNKAKTFNIIMIVLAAVDLISFVFQMINAPLLGDSIASIFKSEFYNIYMIYGIILFLINTFFIVLSLVYSYKTQFTFLDKVLGQKENVIEKKWKFVLFILASLVGYYMLYAIYTLIKNVSQISTLVPSYLVLILCILTCIYDFIYLLFRLLSNKKQQVLTYIALGLNIVALVVFFVFEANNPSFMVHVAKPIALLDYAMSIPFFSYILIIYSAITLVFAAIETIKLILSIINKSKIKD